MRSLPATRLALGVATDRSVADPAGIGVAPMLGIQNGPDRLPAVDSPAGDGL